MFGEGEMENCLVGEGGAWGYGGEGEGGGNVGFDTDLLGKLSRQPTVTEKQIQIMKDQLCDLFRQIIAERQELRRKNIFLQKKMVEFFKKRKMDHVLKVDPKGLDLQGKYLKRLYELQELKGNLSSMRDEMHQEAELLRFEADKAKQEVTTLHDTYLTTQKNFASKLLLKNGKKISTKAITNFLETQGDLNRELEMLRFKEMKEKRKLEQKQAKLFKLDNLGHGLRRADYELLNFEYYNTVKLFEEKSLESKKYEARMGESDKDLEHVRKKLDQNNRILMRNTKLSHQSCNQMLQSRYQSLELKQVSWRLDKQLRLMEKNSGLLTHDTLLRDFEEGEAELTELESKLNNGRWLLERERDKRKSGLHAHLPSLI